MPTLFEGSRPIRPIAGQRSQSAGIFSTAKCSDCEEAFPKLANLIGVGHTITLQMDTKSNTMREPSF